MAKYPRYLPLDDEPDDGCNGHFPYRRHRRGPGTGRQHGRSLHDGVLVQQAELYAILR